MKRTPVSICLAAVNFVFLQNLYASCNTSDSNNISYINCTGNFQNSVTYGGAENYNVNINSTGNFVGSYNTESIFKISGFNHSASVNFNGDLSYDFFSSFTNGSSAAIGIGYTSDPTRKGPYVDFTTAEGSSLTMNVTNSSYPSLSGDQGGVMVGIRTDGGSGVGLTNVVHNGKLLINTSVNNRFGHNYGYSINSFSSNVNIINNGFIGIDSSNTQAGQLKLISIENENKNGLSNNIYFENNGTLSISSKGGISNIGIALYLKGAHDQVVLKNNGLMKEVSGHMENMFYLSSDYRENLFHIINSQEGEISVAGSNAATAINAQKLAAIKLDNYGRFEGNILSSTHAADDIINNSGILLGNIAMRDGNDTFNMIDGEFAGILYTDNGDDTINVYNGKFSGSSVMLGAGNDNFNIYGGDLKATKSIDAGAGLDTLNVHAKFGGATTYAPTDIPTTQLSSFNTINVHRNGYFMLDGDSIQADNIHIMHGGELSLSPNKRDAQINGNVSNEGRINLDVLVRDVGQTLTINGNYHGENATLLVDTQWFNSNDPNGYSVSDKLVINGNVTGKTRVVVENNILGDVSIQNGLKISVPEIEVNGSVAADAFWGYAMTADAGEAQLMFNPERSTDSRFSWVLSTPQGNDIFSPDVPGYVLTPYINLESIRDSIASYRDRIGGEYNDQYKFGGHKDKRAWGRIWHKHMTGHGHHRLDWKSLASGYQLGFQVKDKSVADGSVRSDIYASYVQSSSRAYDRLSTESARVLSNKYAGSMHTHNFNLGFTRTFTGNSNNYHDLVFQISGLKNRYTGRRGGKAENKAWAATLSFEQGRQFNLSERWYVEPMYQIMANYLALEDFNDGVRHVSQGKHWDGLLRAGGRLYFRDPVNDVQNNLVYLKAHYVRDFSNNGQAQIGKTFITESNSKQWMEMGLGFQVNTQKNTYFFLDAKTDRNLGGPYRSTYQVQFGMTHQW